MLNESSEKPQLILQLKRDKSSAYPYHPIAAVYHIKGLDFLVVVDYVKDQISLVVHGFAKDKGRVASRALNSTKGVVGKIISTLTVLDMDFKIANDVLTVLDMRIMVGYRSGQLVAMTCRNNQLQVTSQFNKLIKPKRNIFMRTIESWTDGDEAYDVWIKKPIRQCQVEVSQYNYNQSYQVGDFLIFSRTGSENEEYSLQNTYENVNWNELKGSQGSAKKYQQFECEAMDNYKIAKHNHKAIICLEFTQNVSSYAYYKAQGKQNIMVALMYGKLVIFEAENVKVVRVICFETTIRKIYSFSCFIGIMLYENYFLILNVNDGKCCKLVGHKSFVSGIMFLNNGKMLMTSGMDRTVGMQCMENLLTKCWNKLEAVTKQQWKIDVEAIKGIEIEDRYDLIGASQNQARNNGIDFGFGGILDLGHFFCLLSFDNKLKVYQRHENE